jgi:hypothetical protein
MCWYTTLNRPLIPLLILALSASARAEAIIREEDRIANENPGYCLWASVETLARHNHVRALYGLLASRKTDPDVWEWTPRGMHYRHRAEGRLDVLREKLANLGCQKYRIQVAGRRSTDIIEAAVRAGRGCVVGIRLPGQGSTPAQSHAVVVTEFTESAVRYIDPNDVTHEHTVPRSWFAARWDGFVVCLD